MTGELTTNLNQAPYWDSFDANNNYYAVLAKPGVAVQTREINELQSILQNQIAKFGDNIFVSGTIISGCNLNFDSAIPYAKLQDNYANGSALTVSDLIGFTAVSNSGLSAYIKNGVQGFISNSPNLNTIYIKYLNSATNTAIKVFQNDETLTVYNPANVVIGQIVMANSISSGASNTTGVGYALSVDTGVVYQKGMFLNVDAQTLVVNQYSNFPDGVSVGFTSVESIVTAFQNPLLNDNAQGAPNYAAPGADRLLITPELIVVTSNTVNPNSFFSIVDFVAGSPSVVNQGPAYSAIGDKIAQVSSDTNGSFIITPFNVSVLQANTANAVFNENYLKVKVGAGEAYVNGQNINILGELLSIIPKATTIGQANSQILSTRYGNYVTVQDVAGAFDPTVVETVYLQSANAYGISNNISKDVAVNSISPPGTTIGNAALAMFYYVSGNRNEQTCQYNAYLFGINMAAGYSFNQVASIYANTGSIHGVADIVQLGTGTNTVLYAANSAPLIYTVNVAAMDTLKTASDTVDTQFEFRTATSVSFPTSGIVTVTVPTYTGGTNELPYGPGSVTGTAQIFDFLVVATGNTSAANIGGSVTTTATSNVVTGSGTNFSSSLYPGALISIANATFTQLGEVATVINATSLTTTNPLANSMSASNVYVTFLSGENLPLEEMGANVNIINSTAFSVNLATSLATTLTANVFYNVLRVGASPRKKDLQTQVWCMINCASHPANTVGPWSLGFPDVYNITNVYLGTTWANTNPTTNAWILTNGQSDVSYWFGQLHNNGMALTSASRILVEFSCFLSDVSQGIGFFSVDSYPVDDTGATPNTIFTQDIPTYFSIASQQTYDLRNSIDFRIYVANTIPLINNYTAAVACTAIINPANTSVAAGNILMPVPGALFETSYQYYQGRYDTIGLAGPHGIVNIKSGIPSSNPIPPGNIPNGMTLGTIYIPPYPSVTPDVVDPNMRRGYPTVYINYLGNRRYTMADIGNLDKQIQQLQYYTSLSLLEQSTQNLLLTNSNGATRFNNGMLADPMANFSIANTADPAFNIAIDSANSWARPTFTQKLVNLIPNYYGNTTINDSWITLDFNNVGPIVSQQFASQIRNCSQDILYTWNGQLTLSPTGDYFPDVTTNPTVTVNQNDYSNWINLVSGWNTQWGTWNESTVAVSSSSTSTSASLSATTTTTTKSTTISVTPQTDTYTFGDVVTSVALLPFVRANVIRFLATGLKPSTQFWFYVNDSNQTQNCVQTSGNYATVFFVGSFTSDVNGNIAGIYYMPGNTFNAGALNFQLIDVGNLVTETYLITSTASATYYGTNLAYTQNQLNLQTTEPQFSFNTISSTVEATAQTTVNVPAPVPPVANSPTNPPPTPQVNSAVVGVVNTYCVSPPLALAQLAIAEGGNYALLDPWMQQCHPGMPDPIAQSFDILGSVLPSGTQCVYATQLNVYFQSKDPNLGVTIYMVPLIGGQPSTEILPYSQVHLLPNQVNTSANSSVATTITFPSPVVLEVATSYAFVIIPDGANPNYTVWTGVIGGKDVLTKAPIYSLSSTGEMFLSTQGVTWTPYQNESLKYQLFIANFPYTIGDVIFTNDNSEYLLVSNSYGNFALGDQIFFANPSNDTIGTIGGQAQTTLNSNVIQVGSTSGLVNGVSAVLITSTTAKLSTAYTVANVINSTAFTTLHVMPFTDKTTATVYNITTQPHGFLLSVNSSFMAVTNSTSNASSYLSNSYSYIISDSYNNAGQNIGAGGFCESIALVDLKYDTLMPKFSTSIPSLCQLSINMNGVSNSALSYVSDGSNTNLVFGSSVDFLDHERVVMSRSNEWHYKSGAKSLNIQGVLQTLNSLETPAFDLIKAGAVLVHNIVNAETYNSSGNTIYLSEVNNFGSSNCRYISTTVTLAANVIADDLNVYLGAFYPGNTEIYVYARLLSQYDPTPWTQQVWSPMITQNLAVSSKLNVYDFNEYLFTFANTAPAVGCAFYNQANGGILSYNNPQQSNNLYSGYNQFAIKVVLCADSSMNIPMITDLRAIALS